MGTSFVAARCFPEWRHGMRNHFETLARGGYVARGVVYLLLGGLALTSAVYGGGGAEGSSDALSTILGWPFGRILMGLVAIGLAGYVLWRLAQGLLNAVGQDHGVLDVHIAGLVVMLTEIND